MDDDDSRGVNRRLFRAIDAAKEPELLVGKMETKDDGESGYQVGFALQGCLRMRNGYEVVYVVQVRRSLEGVARSSEIHRVLG
jgi:hypothetical protein